MLKKVNSDQYQSTKDMVMDVVSNLGTSAFRLMPWGPNQYAVCDLQYDYDDCKLVVLIKCHNSKEFDMVANIWSSIVTVNGREVRHQVHNRVDDIHLS